MKSVGACVASALLLLNCAGHGRVLTVHLADYGDADSGSRMRIEMPGGEAPLYAVRAPVLDEGDFKSAALTQDQNGLPALTLCFADAGREKFKRIIEQNVKRRLVFLIRGKLLFAPVIESAAVPECATIDGVISESDLAVLQRAIRK